MLGRMYDHRGLEGMMPLYTRAITAALECWESTATSLDKVEWPSFEQFLTQARNTEGPVEHVTLGEDLTVQWCCTPSLNGAGQTKDESNWQMKNADVHNNKVGVETGGVVFEDPLEEIRRSPYDGRTYTMESLLRTCGSYWSQEQVKSFWQEECKPIPPGKQAALPVRPVTDGLRWVLTD
eukprot:gnl/MRDRNA2_/MRDRNA2_68796_c0_seq2.p2 gnl/MRDRNA2_/MRDRNA2_68796_c0~~gnl/MRDRNA2_/MRDRNA2_68796_c0_seq2.p2  ORF type:complete len:180 (+),score=27.49 gnl/MRDRNA2_/MRDRNA2_68796_c0_seq2:1046-1585(+)